MDKVVDSTEVRERCTRRLAQTVRKNAKSLSSPAETVRYIARNVFQSARTKDVKKRAGSKLVQPGSFRRKIACPIMSTSSNAKTKSSTPASPIT